MLPYQIIVFWICQHEGCINSACYFRTLLFYFPPERKRKANGYYIIFLVGMIGICGYREFIQVLDIMICCQPT